MTWKAIAITLVVFLLILGILVVIAMLIPTNMM